MNSMSKQKWLEEVLMHTYENENRHPFADAVDRDIEGGCPYIVRIPPKYDLVCPKCGGFMGRNLHEDEWLCIQCGWRPVREPTEEERQETDKRETARINRGGPIPVD